MTTTPPTRTLPDRPNLENLKKQAKRLLIDYRDGDTTAVEIFERFEKRVSPKLGLQDAQRVLARSYGFKSWTRLKERVLVEAIKRGDAENLRAVIQQASDPDKLLAARIGDHNPTGHSFGKDTSLLQFASFRQWKEGGVAEVLLQSGARLDLHSACGLGKLDAIRKILKSDPQEVEQEVDTYFPVQYAIAAGQPEAIRVLGEHGDDPNRPIRKVGWFVWEDEAVELGQADWKPVHMATLWAYAADRVPIAATLAETGADLNAACGLDGYRPIHLAAVPNRVHLVQFFVAQGVEVDSRTLDCPSIDVADSKLPEPHGGRDWTPLMVAAGEGSKEVAESLVKLGADVNARNSLGRTPLHIAAAGYWREREATYAEQVQLFLQHGADPKARDADGKLPLDFAQLKGYERTASLLRSQGDVR